MNTLADLLGKREFPLQAWIDRHGAVRRVRVAMHFHLPGLPLMRISNEFYGFGSRVPPVSRPPAKQVMTEHQYDLALRDQRAT